MAIGDWSLKTWQNGVDVVNAANFQRFENKISELDNQSKIILKTANQTSVNDTYANDSKLVIPMAANTNYFVELLLRVFADTQGCDIKTKWTYSGSLNYSYRYALGIGYDDVYPVSGKVMMISDTIANDIVAAVDNGFRTFVRETLVVSALTAGNFQLQFAQYSDTGTLTVEAGSFIKHSKISIS